MGIFSQSFNTPSITFSHHGKVSRKEILEKYAVSTNVLNYRYSGNRAFDSHCCVRGNCGGCGNVCYRNYENFVVSTSIRPSCHGISDYESNPQVWVIDGDCGIWFVIYSDARRKNAYKGTSVEIGGISDLNDPMAYTAIIQFSRWISTQL